MRGTAAPGTEGYAIDKHGRHGGIIAHLGRLLLHVQPRNLPGRSSCAAFLLSTARLKLGGASTAKAAGEGAEKLRGTSVALIPLVMHGAAAPGREGYAIDEYGQHDSITRLLRADRSWWARSLW